jgi:hypothetical protein
MHRIRNGDETPDDIYRCGGSYLRTTATASEVPRARQRGRSVPAVRYLDTGLGNSLGTTVKQQKASTVASADGLRNLLGNGSGTAMKRGTASTAAAGGLALLYDIQSSRCGPRDEGRASNGGKRARPRRLHSELGEIEHERLLR